MTSTMINPYVDETHDPALQSWVESANDPGTDFPIQNLPLGCCVLGEEVTLCTAIGDQVVDLTTCAEMGILQLDPEILLALSDPVLNGLMELGPAHWKQLRRELSRLLAADTEDIRDDKGLRAIVMIDDEAAPMTLPACIGDYTDFYASVHHATNVGRMFRPDNPLMPNYKHLPVGYHGRASSIVPSGFPIRRPMGQTKADNADPAFGPCRLLDYELELGFFVGPGNEMGTRITGDELAQQIFGMVILNDWSARDIQKWEYQPLGPFNAKNFGSTISPWIVTLEALAPFRVPGPPRGDDDPALLDYLKPTDDLGLDITVEAFIASEQMRKDGTAPHRVSTGNFQQMYWTIGQMLAHHTSTGCNTCPGDLLGTGTISGPEKGSAGCLLETTWRGENPIDLPDGTQRKFLQDGDEVILKAYCEREGARRIGFGECCGVVLPAE